MRNSKLALFVVLLQYKNSERGVSEKGLSQTKKKKQTGIRLIILPVK